MAKVTMLAKVSGTRDGVQWPEVGGIIDVSEGEAIGLISGGLAIPYKEGEPVEFAVVKTAQTEQGPIKGAITGAMLAPPEHAPAPEKKPATKKKEAK